MAVSVVDTVRINSTDLKNNEILVVEFCGFRCFLYVGRGRRLPCMCCLERLGTCKCLATGLNAFLKHREPQPLPIKPIGIIAYPVLRFLGTTFVKIAVTTHTNPQFLD